MFLKELQDSVKLLMQSIFAELFTGLLPLNVVLMFDGILNLSLHLPSVDFNYCEHIVYTTIVNFQMNIVYRRKIKNRKKPKKNHISKIYERCLYKQMSKLFDKILSRYMCGFRKRFSFATLPSNYEKL